MDSSTVTAWVDQYVQAWNSNDLADIGALFTDDAAYYTGPFDAPWTGREAIVRGWTQYHEPPREYSNIWLMRFAADGRCREFTEWWVQRRTA